MPLSLALSRSCLVAIVIAAAWGPSRPVHLRAEAVMNAKIEPHAKARAALDAGWSRVIVRAVDPASLPQVAAIVQQAGGNTGRQLRVINSQAAFLPNAALTGLANNPLVAHIALDRVVNGAMERTGKVVGATDVRENLGYDGAGVGVAVIDSGVTPHDDLVDLVDLVDLDDLDGLADGERRQRVVRFVDFVNGRNAPYDDCGHGTHVAGILAGNGFDSAGARTGVAPGAHLVVLKALDASGAGRISDVIAALEYVVVNKDALNIRVVNLSLAAGVFDSYNMDPLTLAAKRIVEAGIVVVAAAGNAGRDSQAATQYGGIMAPGNAPWVLTVGAASHMGTVARSDDVMAAFSSRGPTALDYSAKPDLVAPGVGTESLSAPESALYASLSAYLLEGTVGTPSYPYMSLSGTSMAAPVVSGTVALMLHANPALTPNGVKAILQYTSKAFGAYDTLTQGAGFLNAKGAVRLARFFAVPTDGPYPTSTDWSGRLIWRNRLLTRGRLTPHANAWSTEVTWGSATTPGGEPVTWGETCSAGDCLSPEGTWSPWQASCADSTCGSVVWGAPDVPNVVWGSTCGGADCSVPWTPSVAGAILPGESQGATVVWGSSGADTVVWGTTVVWGSACLDSSCQPVVWGRQ